jgi:mannose-1-phosphate guanylyltransferase
LSAKGVEGIAMKAVILVGGKATRLRPLTCNIPKAIVPVLNTPFLEHVIHHLGRHGIKDIILAQGHLSQPIENYFGDGSQFGVRLSYVVEDSPRGTAGALKNAERYLDETFLMLNGDIFTDLDITTMIDSHREKKAIATIAITPVDDPTAYGLIETNVENRVTHFLEKPSWSEVTTNMINAGTYVVEPDILTQIPAQREVSIERETFPKLLEQGKLVYVFPSSAYWLDMGTPEKYLQLHRDLLSGESRQYAPVSGDEVVIGEHSDIHPTAQIKGPVVIGANCSIGQQVKLIGPVVLGDRCTILEGSVVEESIIWQNTQLGLGVYLKDSVLGSNCHFNAGSFCFDSVLGDNVTVVGDCKLLPGSRAWPVTTVEEIT